MSSGGELRTTSRDSTDESCMCVPVIGPVSKGRMDRLRVSVTRAAYDSGHPKTMGRAVATRGIACAQFGMRRHAGWPPALGGTPVLKSLRMNPLVDAARTNRPKRRSGSAAASPRSTVELLQFVATRCEARTRTRAENRPRQSTRRRGESVSVRLLFPQDATASSDPDLVPVSALQAGRR